MTGLVVVVVAVAVAVTFGLYRAHTDGRFLAPAEPADTPGSLVLAAAPGVRMGERATLVQFSSAFCAPCRATRRTLGEVAELVTGVAHVEIDAEAHLDLVRQLRIQRTPTTLVLDAAGREVARAAGAPHKGQVLSALAKA